MLEMIALLPNGLTSASFYKETLFLDEILVRDSHC